MTNKTCYYEVLGVAKNADDAAIKKAYRSQVKQHHPDRHQDEAEKDKHSALYQAAVEANDVLSDSAKRRVYDEHGFDGLEELAAGGRPGAGQRRAPTLNEMLKEQFGDPAAQGAPSAPAANLFKKGRRRRANGPRP